MFNISSLFMKLLLNNRSEKACKKFSNSYPYPIPSIYSVYGSTKANRSGIFLSIIGLNFRDYSVVTFLNNILPVIFYSSESVMVYFPQDVPNGVYSVQMYNEYYTSNIVYFNFTNPTVSSKVNVAV